LKNGEEFEGGLKKKGWEKKKEKGGKEE